MKKTVLRVYDKNEEYTNTGECYFLILPEEFDPESEWHFEEYIIPNVGRIAGMRWQTYNTYMIATAEVEESEMFWSEIARYELKECKIDINRAEIIATYQIPEWLM